MTTLSQSRFRGLLRRPPLPVIAAALLVIALVVTLVLRATTFRAADPLQGGTIAPVARGPLVASIAATGKVEPRQQAELSFGGATGRVSQVLVAEGDVVAQGAELLRLDTRRLAAEVTAAEAVLAQAQADLQGLKDGATPEQVAAARAQVAAAQGALRQTEGGVTSADLRAARAQVDQAHAVLATLEGTPNGDALARSQASLAEARANLDRQRSALSAAKEQANRTVEIRANELRDAQATYAQALRDKQRAIDDDRDPRTGGRLTDSAREGYVNAAATAERAMQDADRLLAQATVDYQAARQSEIAGLADAEAKLAQAQAALDTLLKPNAEDLAAARAQLATAEARLAQITGAQRQGALEAQQGNLAAAQAQLGELLANPRTSDLARAEAKVAQAEAQLEQARVKLDEAILRAPFAGTVAVVSVAPGEQIGQQAPVTLLDTSRYQVKVTVDEVDVARVAVGQSVEVLLDALGAPALTGTIRRIAPQSELDKSVTAYQVTIEIEPGDRPIKPGMTASASIITDRRDSALSVPAQAVRSENGATVVSLVTTDKDGKPQVTTQPVEIGLRAGDQIEIRGGLSDGQQVLVK
ncbi:MAG: efflux RND transporter periplasmic adaptor subunit [Kouleothrix sp.]|nr:efflux RND transporter periplasmic adaptor subunit [Kouleothrix sp.]